MNERPESKIVGDLGWEGSLKVVD